MKVKVLVIQTCLSLCDPLDCNPPGSSVHGILQARVLEWVATPSSRGSSQLRDWTQVSCITGRFFTIWAYMGKESEKEYTYHFLYTWNIVNQLYFINKLINF